MDTGERMTVKRWANLLYRVRRLLDNTLTGDQKKLLEVELMYLRTTNRAMYRAAKEGRATWKVTQ